MSLRKRLFITIVLMVLIPAILLALIGGGIYAAFLLDGGPPPPDYIEINDELIQNSLRPEGRLFRYVIVFGASAIALVVGSFVCGILYISRKILPPMKELSLAAERISNGDLDFEILGSNVAEIDELCDAFDDMRLRLKHNIAAELELERQRNLMLAHISHDLRTPITSIRGYAEGLLDGVASTEEMRRRYLETISAKATAMERMTRQMSAYSELELGRMSFNFEATDMVGYLAELAEDMRGDLAALDAEFSLDLPDTEIVVRLDREKFGRVFANVFANAVKYRSDERRLAVSLRAEETPTGIHIVLADNGRGIKPGESDKVFEGFYRGDPARSGDTEGHGLGLAIAKQIVAQHSGRIWIANAPDFGAEIHITLPRKEEKSDENSDN